ncbi:MAG: hypothetical protein K8R36_17110 [Planctomycetales bacterium]|nr:hypothetical protein [Planctomycetales bacterium]
MRQNIAKLTGQIIEPMEYTPKTAIQQRFTRKPVDERGTPDVRFWLVQNQGLHRGELGEGRAGGTLAG